MRAIVTVLFGMSLLSACATDPGATSVRADNVNDCAVITAVAKEHYRYNSTDRVPPRCGWTTMALDGPRDVT